jgi:hypothetical protein
MTEYVYDAYDEAPQAPVVQWMDAKPLNVGPAGISAAAIGAVLLGAGLTLAALALAHWVGPGRDLPTRR